MVVALVKYRDQRKIPKGELIQAYGKTVYTHS